MTDDTTEPSRNARHEEIIRDIDEHELTFLEIGKKYGIGKNAIDKLALDAAKRGLLTQEPRGSRRVLRKLWREAKGMPPVESSGSLWDAARDMGSDRWMALPVDKWSRIKRDRGPERKKHARPRKDPSSRKRAITLHRHRSAHARRTARYRGVPPTERKKIIEARNRDILIAYRQGKRNGEIARQFNLTPGAVSNILRLMDPTRGRRRYKENQGKKLAKVEKLDAETRRKKKRQKNGALEINQQTGHDYNMAVALDD